MSDDEEVDQVIAGLRVQFRARVKLDADMMRGALRDLALESGVDARRAALKQLLAAAHRFSGSAASFGFDAIGAAAAPVEEALRAVLDAGGTLAMPAPLGPLVRNLLVLCDAETREENSPQRQ